MMLLFTTEQLNQYYYTGSPTSNNVGVFTATNGVISARHNHGMILHPNNTLYIFGGEGYDTTKLGWLNDLWQLNPVSKAVAFLAGSTVTNQKGVYANKNALLGSRFQFSMVYYDKNDSLIVFAGQGYDSVGNAGLLNDLWGFSFKTMAWEYLSGNDTTNAYSDYNNGVIGCRSGQSMVYYSKNNSLLIFGGDGPDDNGKTGFLNELWSVNLNTFAATLVYGNDTGNLKSVKPNFIGGKSLHSMILNTNDNTLVVFGGKGLNKTNVKSDFNDLWVYDINKVRWTYLNGDINNVQVGVITTPYGTVDSRDTHNMVYYPPENRFIVFGGTSQLVTNNYNDFWKYDYNSSNWLLLSGFNPSNAVGNRSASAMVYYPVNDSILIFGGYGYSNDGKIGYLADLYVITNLKGCAPSYYGSLCNKSCTCVNGTGNCNSDSGNGLCATCNPRYFGKNCDKPCTCNGQCSEGPTGSGACSSCNPNFYGVNCDSCACMNNATCSDTITGSGNCTCVNGYTGLRCEIEPKKNFGIKNGINMGFIILIVFLQSRLRLI
jgi:hypothetical protein